ncbi:uncharacterized protein LOC18437156 isoform X2 [Amborella trichopoda]|uniref:uncharacterized protein LOC18437156 isoform X2 n=1 Tax=Amborella trichopoda TaxID=13333 RepID=UPI0009C11D86|nr:uncharacterized protein LOC18437156 isoform X2 [Amborella trichopoda]|eukprot:XP_020524654.1 uncharacterized protein LOC18437156 isoform X2 [Amborella trichopoda]
MAGEAEELISIFRSQLILKRYDDSTLRVLHTIMHSKDVGLLLSVRSLVREILQSTAFESLKGVEVLEKTVEEKLQIIGFFVHAFALAGDVENSLALKYEALVLRDHVFVNSPHLQVSYDEWLKFAEDSLNNGFYLNAIQGYDHAVLSLQSTHPNHGVSCVQAHEVEEIKKLKDATRTLVTSQSEWPRVVKGCIH